MKFSILPILFSALSFLADICVSEWLQLGGAHLLYILCLVRICSDRSEERMESSDWSEDTMEASDWSEEGIEASDWLLATAASLQRCSAQVSRLDGVIIITFCSE